MMSTTLSERKRKEWMQERNFNKRLLAVNQKAPERRETEEGINPLLVKVDCLENVISLLEDAFLSRRVQMPPWYGPLYDPNHPTHFFDLPNSLRFKIYQMIPSRDRVWAQLVCRQFRNEIRTRVGITAYVDQDTTWGVSFMRDVIYDTIVVGPYKQPKLRPRQLIFRWCEVMHLHFVGSICIPYMDAFLARCRGVQKITINCEITERQPIPKDIEMRRDYKSWRKVERIWRIPIELWSCRVMDVFPKGRYGHLTIQWALQLGHYPSIVKLNIVLPGRYLIHDIRDIHSAVLKFVERHSHIRNVIVDCKVFKFLRQDKKNDFLLSERTVRQISRRTQLCQITVMEECVNFDTWGCFLLDQSELEVLQVMHCCMYPILYFTVKANRLTLRKIAIHIILEYDFGQNLNKPKHMDLTLFSECVALQELYIFICTSYSPFSKPSELQNDVSNFKNLPKALEVLGLKNVTFHKKDLMNLSHLPNLKSFGVTVANHYEKKSHIFTTALLLALLKIRSLNELMVQGTQISLPADVLDLMALVGKETDCLIPGVRTAMYIRDKTDKSNRWRLGKKKRPRFKIVDDNIIYEV